MPRLRILHCLRAPVGGLFRHVCDLAAEQAKAGHAVGVVCDATGGDGLTQARLDALAPRLTLGLFRTPMSRQIGPADVFAYHAIYARALGLDVDVIHGHGAKGGAYARLVGARLKRGGRKIAACYTPHGGSLHYAPTSPIGRIYMALERKLAQMSDGLIFESAYSASRYATQVGVPARDMQVIPNGLAPAEFEAVAADAEAADFLFVGELRALKGVDVLIEALALLRRERPVRAVIVGAGPDADRFKALAAARGLGDAIVFPGAMPARQAFPRGKVLVVPSRAESFPYIVLEAGAARVPLIATEVGGIPEIVAGTSHALVPPDDVDALAAQMRRALEAPAIEAEKAAELQAAIASRFTIASMTTGIMALYYRALGRSG